MEGGGEGGVWRDGMMMVCGGRGEGGVVCEGRGGVWREG